MSKSYKEDGRPSFQFYFNDWLSEPGLRLCSLSARGLWMDMLCYMFKSDFRGLLKANGKQMQSKELSVLTGQSEETIIKLLSELESNNVFSRLDDTTIYNRRMYRTTLREREIKQKRSDAGKQGGRPPKKQTESKEESKTKAKEPASSSSSFSSSSSTSIKEKETVLLFWNYYNSQIKKTFNKSLIKLTTDRKNLIKKKLKDYSLDQLKKAVDNFILDPWGERINRLDLIYCIGKQQGKADNLEKWLSWKSGTEKKEDTLREQAIECAKDSRNFCPLSEQGIETKFCKLCSRYEERKEKYKHKYVPYVT